MRALLGLTFLTISLTGCLGEGEPAGPSDPSPEGAVWAERALPFGEGHDHTDSTRHRGLSTANFELVGWDPLVTDYTGASAGSYWCGEVATAGERDIAVVDSFDTEVAFVVLDVTDPANPEKIGEYVLHGLAPTYTGTTYDVTITPDGQYVLLAVRAPPRPGPGLPIIDAETTLVAPMFRSGCSGETVITEEPVPLASGVALVDLSDPTAPTLADFVPQPVYGPHSVFSTEIDGTTWALVSTTNLAYTASYFMFYTVEEGPLGPRLAEQGVYSANYPDAYVYTAMDPQNPLLNGHVDGWIQKHPVTGDLLAYLCNWSGGIHIVRIDGVGQLTQVATWNDYDPAKGSEMTGQFHGAYPVSELWDGKHYTFVGQEIGTRPANRPTGQVIMFDTTAPASPTPIARWTLPVDVEWDSSLVFSTHYFQTIGRTLFVAMYHGGVWAVDADPANAPDLLTVGVYIADQVSPSPAPTDPNARLAPWTPEVLDVLALPSGDLLFYDGTSGAYIVRFDAGAPIVPPPPWTEDAWLPA